MRKMTAYDPWERHLERAQGVNETCGRAYQAQVLDKGAAQLERIVPHDCVPRGKRDDVLEPESVSFQQRPHAARPSHQWVKDSGSYGERT